MEKNYIQKQLILALLILIICFIHATHVSYGQNKSEDTDVEPTYQSTTKMITVYLLKNNGTYTIKNMDVGLGDFEYLSDYKIWENKFYNGRLTSFKEIPLGFFSVTNSLAIVQCRDTFDKDGNMAGGCSELPEGELTIQLPYFPNGKYADIFDPSGKKVLTIDLSSKATCNENDRCDRPVEDSENCPQDCKKNEPKIDPAVVQLSANNQVAAQEAEKKISLADLGWRGVAILIVLLAGGGVGYYVYRRNRIYQE